MLQPFVEDISSRLLFLRSIETIEVFVWEQGQSAMQLISRASVESMTEDSRLQRRALMVFLRKLLSSSVTGNAGGAGSVGGAEERREEKYDAYVAALRRMQSMRSVDIPRPIVSLWIQSFTACAWCASNSSVRSGASTTNGQLRLEHYLVSNSFGGPEDFAFIASDVVRRSGLVLVPYAAVAARVAVFSLPALSSPSVSLSSSSLSSMVVDESILPLVGRVFCCLPTTLLSGLPVHVDARWELTRDRNHLCGGSGFSE